jgi:hypothetical protein
MPTDALLRLAVIARHLERSALQMTRVQTLGRVLMLDNFGIGSVTAAGIAW